MAKRENDFEGDLVLSMIRNNTPLNQLRADFCAKIAEMEQRLAQEDVSGIGMRKMEFKALNHLMSKAEELGLVKVLNKAGRKV